MDRHGAGCLWRDSDGYEPLVHGGGRRSSHHRRSGATGAGNREIVSERRGATRAPAAIRPDFARLAPAYQRERSFAAASLGDFLFAGRVVLSTGSAANG